MQRIFCLLSILLATVAGCQELPDADAQNQMVGIATQANSSILSYETADGKRIFVDSLEKVPEQYKATVSTNLRTITKVPAINYTGIVVPSANTSREVLVYQTSWCPYCKELERDLTKAGIAHRKLDIEKNNKAREDFQKLGGSGVPLVSVGGKVVPTSIAAIRAAMGS